MQNSVTQQPKYNIGFSSDNIAGASAEVINAIVECNTGTASPYGTDNYTAQVEEKLRQIFETDLSVFIVPTGSAANALCLATLTPPWGAVLCHPDSHINNDECGAPEFFTNGAKLIEVAGQSSKIDPLLLQQEALNKVGDVHSVQPSVVSITQATETGSIYNLDEIKKIGDICRNSGLRLHMDGARFANALVSLDCSAAEMTWKAGVDALSFGATKNGVLAAEVIVLFDKSLAQEMAYRRKRAGHLLSKMRLLSSQINAYLSDDLWLNNARHANQMALRLEEGLTAIEGVELQSKTEANIIFCKLPLVVITGLLEQGFHFYHDRWGQNVIRLVTNFTSQPEEIDLFLQAARTLMASKHKS
ncbi:threonine aldolase family protein [Amphritea balenae]|uniref:L-threonine aldolase n=1 Tax=Amphritea balenae TaxID=452629 RepID=A0A3P1SS86_9GAMM|nr:low specificity L-threonine aldolase [Amphritea balenae]RRD00008.1 low specificity L-threonine aldolase [Amphritea balenae]GGK75832.1 L-threonine aldolase [Amphritea balenae]